MTITKTNAVILLLAITTIVAIGIEIGTGVQSVNGQCPPPPKNPFEGPPFGPCHHGEPSTVPHGQPSTFQRTL